MDNQDKKPWYPWYPRDYATDGPVTLMTMEAEGCYRRLLDHQWLNGSIPAAAADQARLCKGMTLARWRVIWRQLEPCFQPLPDGKGYVNRRLEIIRGEQEAKHSERSESGKRGAQARWRKVAQDRLSDLLADSSANSSANGSGGSEPIANRWQPEEQRQNQSQKQTPPPTTTTPRSAEGERPLPTAEEVAIQATVALNKGLQANHRVNQATLRAVSYSEQLETVTAWLEAGISVATILTAVRGLAEHWKPKPGDRQLWGLSYCNDAVRRLHEQVRMSEAAGASPFVEA